MLFCPLCNESIIIVTSLCSECKMVRQLMNLYSKKTVIDILDEVLLRKTRPNEIQNKVSLESVKHGKKNESEIEELD